MGGALLRCLLCSSRCCPCRELRPCPCCLPRRPCCRPCGLQLRPGLPLCLPLHRRRCPRRHPRCRRSLRWCRTLRPTPPEPSMLPRGRLRLTPTTTEDTVSDTGPTEETEDTASDTAVATSTVRFCLDVLDLDATMLPTFCPWIGPTRI